jgi:hypothetical protein
VSKTIKVSNGDYNVSAAGRFSYVGDGVSGSDGREKASQDLANCLLQLYDPETGWGTYLSELSRSGAGIGTREQNKLRVHSEVSEGVERLMSLQSLDDYITEDEQIDKYSVIVEESDDSPLDYVYYLAAQTVAGDEPISKAFLVELGHVKDPNLQDLQELAQLAGLAE